MSQVSFSMYSPMDGDNWGEKVFIQGQAPPPPGSNENWASWVRVSNGYFETIGTKILKGRAIPARTPPLAICGRCQSDFCQKVF